MKKTTSAVYECQHCQKPFFTEGGAKRHEKYFCLVMIGKRELEKQSKQLNK